MMQLKTYHNFIYFVLMEHYIDGALNIAMFGYIVAPTFAWHISDQSLNQILLLTDREPFEK